MIDHSQNMLGKFMLGFNIDAQTTEKYYTQHYNLRDIYSELLIIITIMIIVYKLTFHIAALTIRVLSLIFQNGVPT